MLQNSRAQTDLKNQLAKSHLVFLGSMNALKLLASLCWCIFLRGESIAEFHVLASPRPYRQLRMTALLWTSHSPEEKAKAQLVEEAYPWAHSSSGPGPRQHVRYPDPQLFLRHFSARCVWRFYHIPTHPVYLRHVTWVQWNQCRIWSPGPKLRFGPGLTSCVTLSKVFSAGLCSLFYEIVRSKTYSRNLERI